MTHPWKTIKTIAIKKREVRVHVYVQTKLDF